MYSNAKGDGNVEKNSCPLWSICRTFRTEVQNESTDSKTKYFLKIGQHGSKSDLFGNI